jgi:hypothetical protein
MVKMLKTTCLYRRGRFLPLVMLLLPAALPAAVSYTYTGNHFNTFLFGTYTSANYVSITLTFNTGLAANMAFQTVTPASFTISDGIDTITSSNYDPSNTLFQVSTNASGGINAWSISIVNASDSAQIRSFDTTTNDFDQGAYAAAGTVVTPGPLLGDAFVTGSPGTWGPTAAPPAPAPAATPAPTSMILALTGLAGLGLYQMSRFRQQA